MNFVYRTILSLALVLMFPFAGGLSAQDEPAAAEAAPEAASQSLPETPEAAEPPAPEAEEGDVSSYELRNQFSTLLRQHPRELATILALDPSLLHNDEFLSGYPELARFVEEHPEIRRNSHFYLAEFRPHSHGGVVGDIIEGLAIFGTFLLIALALGWFIRTLIEQKRWNRLSQTQSEVHNKILDRFESSEELLEYVKSPAGTRFLESAPIPLHEGPVEPRSPWTRVVWSVQIGVVVAATALGMLLVSLRFDEEAAQGLFALGVIAFSIGVGFVGSAAVSVVLSRRLGLWQGPDSSESETPDRFDDSGLVR